VNANEKSSAGRCLERIREARPVLEQRLGRSMTTTRRKLALFGGVAAAVIFIGWDVFAGIATPAPAMEEPPAMTAPSPVASAPTLEPEADNSGGIAQDNVSYAIAVAELAGLSPNATPGTVLQLWVTWDPPVTKRPRLQKLLEGVVLDEIAPPVTPDGPHVALLSVARSQLDELLWADRYGSLSAAVIARS
jgi:hypothetical protein